MINCWERDNPDPNERCITCGESKVDSNGKRVSLETVLTDEFDQALDNCFDYMFELRMKGSKQPFRIAETMVEKMKVEQGSTRVYDG